MKKKRIILSTTTFTNAGSAKHELENLSGTESITDIDDAIEYIVTTIKKIKRLLPFNRKLVYYNEHIDEDDMEIDFVIADNQTGKVKTSLCLFIDENDYVEVIDELTNPKNYFKNRIRLFKTAEEARAYVSECIQNSDYTVDEDKSSLNKIYASYKSIVREFTIVE